MAAVVIFSGHFTDEQLQMIDELAAAWNAKGGPDVKSLAVNRTDVPGFPPDHAGLFETTLLDGLIQGLIDLPALGTERDVFDRFDPASPLWDIVGTDPRNPSHLKSDALVQHVVAALAAKAGSRRKLPIAVQRHFKN